MTYTIYLLYGLLLGFILGTFAGFGMAQKIIDEAIKKAWVELIINNANKKEDGVK